MKFKSKFILFLVSLILIFGISVAYAASLTNDGILDSTNALNETAPVILVNSSAPCTTTTTVGVFRFDMTAESGQTVSTAAFSVTVLNNALAGAGQISLVPITNNDFGSLTNADVDLNNPIVSKAFADVPANGLLAFSGQDLVDYLNTRTGNVSSFALAITQCTAGGPALTIGSSENPNSPVPVLETTTTNVALQSFRAGDNGISPVVWIGALLVMVLLVGAFVVVRRRPTNS